MTTRQHLAPWRWPALLLVSALLLAGCDWPMLGYGPAHTGDNSTETVLTVGNVAGLAPRFVAPDGGLYGGSSVAVVNGVVYAGTDDGVYAFDARGTTGCSGTPTTCAPLWKGAHGPALEEGNAPAVANGVVYFSAQGGSDLQAFDAEGVTGCAGAPKVCSPLWTATMNGGSAPTVANGVVYINGGSGLEAFDANGVMGCSGTPKVCTPLWTGAGGGVHDSSPAVANGIVYTGGADLAAFDANGVTGCSGTPKVCTPLWARGDILATGTPAVANGVVYTNTESGNGLSAFDATTGTALWHANVDCIYCASSPAVAKGMVYIGGGITRKMYAYDATTGALEWSATTGDILRSSPSVANGVVYLGTNDWNVYAFDASGTTGCSGAPKTCAPLWTFTTDGNIWSSPAIVNGRVYVGSSRTLYAFGLP
jgi:outer membrane protein assembly factor BamB